MPIIGDGKLLFQAFSNLLSNAVKYSPGGGAIELGAELDGEEVVVAVIDRGIGIPAGDLNRVFERYHRGSNVSGIVGTGVGLYLVKMTIDLHRGWIEVKSKEGEGSRFTVHLPIRRAAPDAGHDEQPVGADAAVADDAPSMDILLAENVGEEQ